MTARWSSRFSFVMAATGAAVGLGNIWKFPYMAGENGGGAFVLLYLGFVLLIGIPALIAEILIGRLGRENPVNTLQKLALQANHSVHWRLLGWWGALGLVLVLSFYSVVAGWAIGYLLKIWSGGFVNLHTQADFDGLWDQFLADPKQLLLWHTVFMILTLGIVAFGIKKGLERAAKILMPGLFCLLILLFIYSVSIGNLKEAVAFLLQPHFSQLTAGAVISALGHAFFTLALGAGAMLVYGSYLPNHTRIASSVLLIAGLDVLVALVAGLSIFSLVFAYDLPAAGGAGLMFKVLPMAFAKMPAGQLFGGLFFLLLWFAAWAASISMAEPLVVLLIERCQLQRKRAALWVGALCWTLGLLPLLSFNELKMVRLFGSVDIFTAMTDLTTNLILPVGGFCFALFAGWVLKKEETKAALNLKSRWAFRLWHFLIRYVAPIGILVSFICKFWQ